MTSPLPLLNFVEDRFRCDVLLEFVHLGSSIGFDAHPIGDR
jgi:hypothetical protein